MFDAPTPDISDLRRACEQPYGFWLDSALADDSLGRASYFGAEPGLILRSWGATVEVWTRGGTHRSSGSPFEMLRELLRERAGTPGAAVGYLAYELKRFVEQVPARARDDLGLPECHLCFYDRVARFDPRPLVGHAPAPRRSPLDAVEAPPSNFEPADYKRAVQRVRDYIVAGDVYQVNLSQRFSLPLADGPFDAYLRLRASNPAPFAAFISMPEANVLSASPERFLSFDPVTRRVQTRPIKGTRPRGRTAAEDEALAAELLASAKDRAENVMIVDLERNDLGRVAAIGSVRVTELAALETFPTVFHLTSTVETTLREDRDLVDLLLAAFPGGSITGAPKIRAMEIIAELESVPRGVYCGSMFAMGFDGRLTSNVAIRTLQVEGDVCHLHAGGGIVSDSDPTLEFEETMHKARGILEALGLSE